MVEAAIARYDVELRVSVDVRVAEVLCGSRTVGTSSCRGFVRDRVLEIVGEMATHADPERAGRGTVYRFADATYQAVREELGLKRRRKPSR